MYNLLSAKHILDVFVAFWSSVFFSVLSLRPCSCKMLKNKYLSEYFIHFWNYIETYWCLLGQIFDSVFVVWKIIKMLLDSSVSTSSFSETEISFWVYFQPGKWTDLFNEILLVLSCHAPHISLEASGNRDIHMQSLAHTDALNTDLALYWTSLWSDVKQNFRYCIGLVVRRSLVWVCTWAEFFGLASTRINQASKYGYLGYP